MKKLKSKLVLRKETISNLTNQQMNSIKGGTGTTLHHTEKSVCPMDTCTCSQPEVCGGDQSTGSWCVCE